MSGISLFILSNPYKFFVYLKCYLRYGILFNYLTISPFTYYRGSGLKQIARKII